jgi:SAM-dependent methyltransferase
VAQRQTPAFDARSYWESRLGRDWNLQGVGLRRLGGRFNAWAYRLRGEVFQRVVTTHLRDLGARDVLDIGSGTGFYVDAWRHAGARSITGVDLTEAAVGRLTQRFPDVRFVRRDVSDGLPEMSKERFDVVSAMDVLFHILDDRRFEAALRTVAQHLRPGGTFLYSDMFLRNREIRETHAVYRRLSDIERAVQAAGLEIVTRTPMFVYMIQPLDADSRLVRGLWTGGAGVASLAEPLGEIAGRALYALDSRLVTKRSESPSIEIMVCRRP